MLVTLGIDWPYEAVPLGRPCPRKDLFEVEPAGAEVVREDEVLPRLVVLYSVFGLVENTEEVVFVCLSIGLFRRGGVKFQPAVLY